MTDESGADRLRRFLAVRDNCHFHNEGEQIAHHNVADGGAVTITDEDLRAVLRERDELAEKLAAATRAVVSLAAQRDSMETALNKANQELHVITRCGDVFEPIGEMTQPHPCARERGHTGAHGNIGGAQWWARDASGRARHHQHALIMHQAETIERYRAAASSGVDLIRYLPGVTEDGRLALWCTDCVPYGTCDAPFWTDAEASEQVTELCLANLVAIAEQHEREHHADERTPDPLEVTDSWARAQAEDDLAQQQVTADLRAARDMFRRPEDGQAAALAVRTTIDRIIAEHDERTDRHFSPGYDGEKPDHHGPADTCAMPACVKSRKQHEAAAYLQDLTYEILGDQTRAFPGMDWLIWSHEHGAWWRPFERGYTGELPEAGRYIQARAEQICRDANAYGWVNGLPKEVMIPWTDDPQTAAAAVRNATGELIAERAADLQRAAADAIQDANPNGRDHR